MDLYLNDNYPDFNNYKVVMPVFGANPNPFAMNYSMRPDGTLCDGNNVVPETDAAIAIQNAINQFSTPEQEAEGKKQAEGYVNQIPGGSIINKLGIFDKMVEGYKQIGNKAVETANKIPSNKTNVDTNWVNRQKLTDGQIITYGYGDERIVRVQPNGTYKFEMYYNPKIKWITIGRQKFPAPDQVNIETGQIIKAETPNNTAPEQKMAVIQTDNTKMYMLLGAAAIGLYLLTKNK